MPTRFDTIIPKAPDTIPAPPPTEENVEELWNAVLEQSKVTLRPSWLPEEEQVA